GEDADQDGERPGTAEPLDERVEVRQVVEDLRHREERAGLDLAAEAVDLKVEVVGRRVDPDPGHEGRGRVDRPASEVLAAVKVGYQLRQPDRVDLVHAA